MIESRTIRWTGHVAHMAWVRNVYGVLKGKSEGKGLV
jgi:hypothetical protein